MPTALVKAHNILLDNGDILEGYAVTIENRGYRVLLLNPLQRGCEPQLVIQRNDEKSFENNDIPALCNIAMQLSPTSTPMGAPAKAIEATSILAFSPFPEDAMITSVSSGVSTIIQAIRQNHRSLEFIFSGPSAGGGHRASYISNTILPRYAKEFDATPLTTDQLKTSASLITMQDVGRSKVR